MPVNRIYFRGVKTFQSVFAYSLILSLVTGCTSLGTIQVISQPVSMSPNIIDIQIHGVCEEGHVLIEHSDPHAPALVALGRKKSVIQGHDTVWEARVDLDEAFKDQHVSSNELNIVVRCQTHGDRVISQTVNLVQSDNLIVPDWAKGLVWYQVFPERFRDGNPQNNPNSWDVTPVEWDMDFGKVASHEIELAWNRRLVDPRRFRGNPGRKGGAVANVIYQRRFGGDLIGLYNQLELLSKQGYTGIYLCPVFQSRSLHKYDADDHRHIDPTLGHPGEHMDPGPGHTRLGALEDPSDESTWEWTVADQWFIDEFLPKAKSLGLRVVLDGVWNHVGMDHFAFSDIVDQGDSSAFVDWFDVEFDENGKLFAWQGWGRVNGNLPEFKQTESGDLVAGPKAHVMAVTRRWMDPNGDGDPSDGIDGWRLDVAGEIGKPFWKDWRAQVRMVNPEALIIAEIWSDAGNMFHDEGFDGQMNYPLAYAVSRWLSIGERKGDAQLCADRLNAVFQHAPEHDLVQFNLMTSHDTERLASMMHNDHVRGYDNDSSRWSNTDTYEPLRIDRDDRDRALAAIAVMVAAPGSVMMYNGDEYAMSGADDPDNRRPIPWATIENQQGLLHPDSSVVFNEAVNELLRLRQDPEMESLLRFGSAEFIGIENGKEGGLLLVRRILNDRMVEFLIADDPASIQGDALWPAPQKQWGEVSEKSRKFGVQGGETVVRVRYLIANRP